MAKYKKSSNVTQVKGIDSIVRNMNIAINRIDNVTLAGLIKASIIIRRDMDNTSPLIPLKTGNLRQSWFVVASKKGVQKGSAPAFKGKKADDLTTEHSKAIAMAQGEIKKMPIVIMGFSANYAAPVHEMIKSKTGKPINWSRPGSGPYYFQSAIERNKDLILKTIKDNAK